MRRFLFALLIIIGASGCAAPTPAEPTPSDPAAANTHAPIITPTLPGMQAPKPSEPPLAEGKDSALLMGYRDLHNNLMRVDLATGKPMPSIDPVDAGKYQVYSLSPDGSQLALFKYPNAETPAGGTLELVDTKTLHSETVEGVSFPVMVNSVTHSPDGQYLAVTLVVTESTALDAPVIGWRIALVDLDEGAITAQVDFDFSLNTLRFSPDGATIAIYGVRYGTVPDTEPGTPQVALLDAADLRRLWAAPVDGLLDGFYQLEGTALPNVYAGIQWSPAAVFSADAAKLYLAHANVDKLTTVDFARKTITTVDIGPQKTFLDRLMGFGASVAHAKAIRGAMLSGALSADGSQVFVTGTKMDFTTDSSSLPEFTNTPLGVRMIDLATGALLMTLDTDAISLELSDDGRQLFLYNYDQMGTPLTQIVDAQTFKSIASVPDFQIDASPLKLTDGRRGLLAIRWRSDAGITLGVVDADTFKPISSWLDHDSSGWVTTSQ